MVLGTALISASFALWVVVKPVKIIGYLIEFAKVLWQG
jgi:hypothetical protein